MKGRKTAPISFVDIRAVSFSVLCLASLNKSSIFAAVIALIVSGDFIWFSLVRFFG